jgi:cytochrome c oxidase subunit 1/cytochrome c oxidase subunit I+III
MPEDTLTPFLMAVALTVLFAALLLKSMAVAAAATLLCLLVAAVWLWPEEERVVRA